MPFNFTFSLVHQALALLTIIIGFGFGFWVYLSDRKSKINQLFLLLTLSIFLWVPLPFFFNLSVFSGIALLLVRWGYAAVSLFMIAFYFFALYFPRKSEKRHLLDVIILSLGLFIFILSFTPFLIKNIEFTDLGVNPIFGEGKIFYFISLFIMSALYLFIIFKKYFILIPHEKLRAQYFLLGLSFFVAINLFFNVILPILGQPVAKFYYFGNYSAVFLLGLTAFAIVKQELFGMKVILTQFLVGVIAIFLLAQAVTATGWDLVWKFILFLTFLPFGYFLIKSVIQEIKRRAEIQRLYNKLEKLDEAKTEFMSIVSHQLRTPLTAIKGYTSMILEGIYGKFSDKMEKPLNNTLSSSERLIKFVNDILDVTRIETGRIEFTPKKTSLEEVVSSVVFELEIKAKEKNLALKWKESKKPLPEILIDPDKIRQVILNLIDNAIKYTNKGEVKINCKIKNKKYLISVSDTGTGMSKEEIFKLFKSFSRGESGVAYYKEGTGLGLYIGRKFVEMQGGKTWAESPGKGRGSTFYIELPIK